MTDILYSFADPDRGVARLQHEVELLERELNKLRHESRHRRSTEQEIALGQEIMAGIISRGVAINLIENGHGPYQWACKYLESAGIVKEDGYTALVFNIAPSAV